MAKKKLVGYINFKNGSKFRCYLMGKVPSLAKDANDYIYLKIITGKDRGSEDMSFYMNIYDANNLIWVLTSAILAAQ